MMKKFKIQSDDKDNSIDDNHMNDMNSKR